jgi:hypothetical protein
MLAANRNTARPELINETNRALSVVFFHRERSERITTDARRLINSRPLSTRRYICLAFPCLVSLFHKTRARQSVW